MTGWIDSRSADSQDCVLGQYSRTSPEPGVAQLASGHVRSVFFYIPGNPTGGSFVRAVTRTDPRALPLRYGDTEPLRHRYEQQAFLRFWRAKAAAGNGEGDMLGRSRKPWSEGQLFFGGSCDDDHIRPARVPCVTYLVLDHAHPLTEAAPVFDAVAGALGAAVAIAEPEWTPSSDEVPVRGWFTGLPRIRAQRWWFGRTYVDALGGDLPLGAEAVDDGIVIADSTWVPPSRLCRREFERSDFDSIERELALATDPVERKRLIFRQNLWHEPAKEIPPL